MSDADSQEPEIKRPLPQLKPRMRPFWRAASDGRLVIQRCPRCMAHFFPAVDLCPSCLDDAVEWVAASGHATVFSFVVMHQVYHLSFAEDVPYAVVDVVLAEGPHLISHVRGVAPAQLAIGMELVVEFEATADGISLPVFRLAA